MSYDPSTIATLRRALDEVLLDRRFYLRALAASGERDLERLKSSTFKKLTGSSERLPDQAA
jgi:hypothetical protein